MWRMGPPGTATSLMSWGARVSLGLGLSYGELENTVMASQWPLSHSVSLLWSMQTLKGPQGRDYLFPIVQAKRASCNWREPNEDWKRPKGFTLGGLSFLICKGDNNCHPDHLLWSPSRAPGVKRQVSTSLIIWAVRVAGLCEVAAVLAFCHKYLWGPQRVLKAFTDFKVYLK